MTGLTDDKLKKIIYETSTDVSWLVKKVDTICGSINNYKKETDDSLDVMNKRITQLEEAKNRICGGLVVLGAIIGGAWAKLTKLF